VLLNPFSKFFSSIILLFSSILSNLIPHPNFFHWDGRWEGVSQTFLD
jgi:hypothetical protein